MGSTAVNAQALPEQLTVKPVIDLTAATFYSDKSYDGMTTDSKSWQEVVAKYGVEAEYKLDQGTLYSSLIAVSSATFGDGDAAGITTGDERKTSLEQWNLGWRNGSVEDATIDASIGRQKVQIADGFLVAGDALNFGKGYGDELDRGGAYYLAARQSFDMTAVLHYQINDALKTHWYYLESSNKAQNEAKLWSADFEYQYANSDFGLTYLQITDVADKETQRDDLKDIAVRAKKQVNEQLALAAEYVHQDQKQGNENAWYASAQYTFDQVKYQPTLGYRFSSFSEQYDGLFYGNTDAGFGTWFQGEVAANYSGPYSTNARIHQLSLQGSVQENLHLGVLGYKFDTIDKSSGENLDGAEVDLFAVWSPTQNVNVIPLIGFYKPKKDVNNGGAQMGDKDTNTYAQLILQYVY
ncbi:hypothetical protein A3K93_13200 (plasmid) [Acinetobacter sp. NCu2D-2]|nr:hypothetical protein A3K93_13200 [Acinetobacter sp. NCu2D-2]